MVGGRDLARVIQVDETDAVLPLATSTLQTSGNTKLDTLHTDLAAVLAKIIAAPATEATAAAILAALSALPVRGADGIVTCSTDIIRPADTTAYTINDAISDSTSAPTVGGFTFTNAVRAAGRSCVLTDLIVTSSNPAATALQGELYIFDTAVTAVNDNAVFAVSDAEIKTLVAKIPFVMGVGANNNHVHVQNLGIGLTAVGGRDFRFLIKALNAYAPANAEVFTFRAKFAPVD
ncbi:hypothetical protein [Mesorhizobium sp.]|uniref:hypothetical protein n=1 Tax=Mesorhizobium sp. TaxID=1871066 RepID=UPI000FEA2564|nr:hypothetical protein [Mesorhizobium sp.]RWP31826.1 MAG: hypothetical protein EOR02_08410 [Mesorhizobium sp.]